MAILKAFNSFFFNNRLDVVKNILPSVKKVIPHPVESTQNAPHIIQIDGNTKGCDFIGTDPHGCLGALEEAVNLLEPNDRLFLCGDLIDRGPASLDVIRHINKLNACSSENNKKIYAVRGNHEDMVLWLLQAVDMIDASLTMKSIRDNFQLQAHWLRELVKWYDWNSSSSFYFERFLQETVHKFGEKSKFFRFFKHVCTIILNGGGWIFELTPKERAEVKAFIKPLPYMIRVKEVSENKKNITSYDIVHAAPLSEKTIQTALADKNPTFSSDDIEYMTWARPTETSLAGSSTLLIQPNGRTPESIRTYVGHNTLSAYHEIFPQINTVNLDTETISTGAMFIVNHTQKKVLLAEAKTQDPKIRNISQAEKGIQSFFAIIDFIQVCSPKELYGEIYKEATQHKVGASEPSVNYIKQNFLLALNCKIKKLTLEQRVELASYLLEIKDNILAKERDYVSDSKFWSRKQEYSHETKSMHKAIGMLLKGIHTNKTLTIKKSWLEGTKITLKNSTQNNTGTLPQENSTSSFSRYRRFI